VAGRQRTAIPVVDAGGPKRTCQAPAVAMHFTVTGSVHACCQNGAYEFGDVRTDTLQDIWEGIARRAMADALAGGRYPLGCEQCEIEHALGSRATTPAPAFDRFEVDGPSLWPRQMEFTLSNRCNLACVQCNGDNSSTIRSRREGRPPLPMPYGDGFFAQLAPFLEHLEVTAFLGGEPFLTPQDRRVWDMLIDRDLRPVVEVTTNATVWNDRVERYVHDLQMDLAVSIDGFTKATYEAIRVGARHDRVTEIRDRMIAAVRSYDGTFQLNYCLMRTNWHEVGRYLAEADELGVNAYVIPVFAPSEHSLFTLPAGDLAPIVARLAEEDAVLAGQLGQNRATWDRTVRMVTDQLARLGSDQSRDSARRRLEAERRREAERAAAAAESEMRAWAGRDCIEVQTEDGRIRTVHDPDWAQALHGQDWVGLDLESMADAVGRRLGPVEYRTREMTNVHGELVVHTESDVTTSAGVLQFRSVFIPSLDRLIIASPDPIG
jgi:MoaA/NifB/PqqE/SkfB family radical SAM enzyme